MTSRSFAEILSESLDAHGLSPGQAADNLRRDGYKIDRGTLTRWRNGQSIPSLNKRDVIKGLPQAIGMSPAEAAEFTRLAGAVLGFEAWPRRSRPRPAAAIPQRIHFGAEMLPPFAGRANELAELQRLVIGRRSVLITGLAGVGKTRLAQEVLRSCVGYFAHGCEFLTITEGLSSDRILRNVARLLNIELRPGDSTPEYRRSILRRMREQLQGIDLLFLIDNVENAEQVRDLVHELPAITWIITARRVSLKRIGVHPVHLDLPTPEDATAIFQAHVAHGHGFQGHAADDAAGGRTSPNQPFDAQLAAGTIEMAGRLPIAIRLMSGLVTNGTVNSAAELRAWMSDGGLLRSGLHARKMPRFFDQVMESVPPESRLMLEACGIFATRLIQIVNLNGVCRRAGIPATAAALEGLSDFSLIDFPDESRVALHPLVHEYARQRLRAGPRYEAVQAAFNEHYLQVARAISEAAPDTGRDYRQLARMESNLLKVAGAFHETGDWPRLRAIWPALSGYLWNTGNYGGYEAFDRQCLDAARAMGDTGWEATILSELGFVAMETGAWDEADALFQRSQAIHDQLPDHRIAQARLRRYRALLAMKQGDSAAAFALLSECEGLLAGLTNPPETMLDAAYSQLYGVRMSVYFRLLDDRPSAERAGLAGYDAYRRLGLREGGHRIGEFRLELGDVLYLNGKREAARQMWEEMAASQEGLPRSPDDAEARLRLAWLQAREGSPEAAARLADEARRTFLRHGRVERFAAAERLLECVEGEEPLPGFEDVMSRHYPSY